MAEAAEKTKITMTDGREVGFGKRQKLEKTVEVNGKDVSVRLDFVNGQTRLFEVPKTMFTQFVGHGASQKLGDVIAGEDDIDDAVLAVDDLIARLNAGEWTVPRAKGGFSGSSVLLRALVEVSGKTQEEIVAYLATKTQAEKLALRRNDKIRPTVERIEAEKAKNTTSKVDTDALLAELAAPIAVAA